MSNQSNFSILQGIRIGGIEDAFRIADAMISEAQKGNTSRTTYLFNRLRSLMERHYAEAEGRRAIASAESEGQFQTADTLIARGVLPNDVMPLYEAILADQPAPRIQRLSRGGSTPERLEVLFKAMASKINETPDPQKALSRLEELRQTTLTEQARPKPVAQDKPILSISADYKEIKRLMRNEEFDAAFAGLTLLSKEKQEDLLIKAADDRQFQLVAELCKHVQPEPKHVDQATQKHGKAILRYIQKIQSPEYALR